MNLTNRRHILAWLAVLLLAAASVGFGWYRLQGLPSMGMTLGPELTIRSVWKPDFAKSDTPKFKRGDRLVALEGHLVEDLRDLRVVLRSIPEEKKFAAGEEQRGVKYQVDRPLHRYTIALQGEQTDPTALPPGYNPKTDRLVEIDGRPLPDEIGPEGVRSIVGSRPDALLTFERRDAVFKGNVSFERSDLLIELGISFALVALLVLLIWGYRSEKLHPWSTIAISFETVCLGWIMLLGVNLQWMMSDYFLTSVAVAALVLVRPLAIFARTKAVQRGSTAAGWWALGVGAGFVALVVGLLHGGVLENAEMALYAGASGAAFYLVYELFLVAFDDVPHMTLQEGGGYLAGILMVGIATAIFTWNFEPVVFREDLWRWYTIAFTALVWFGDVLFAFRGAASVGYGDVATVDQRRDAIRRYLVRVSEEMPHTTVQALVRRQGSTAAIDLQAGELRLEEASEEMSDLMAILLQEQARIPLPDTIDRAAHPLNGIAQTMDIVLALRLQPPTGGMHLPDTEIVLVAVEAVDAGDLPTFASAETIDLVQRELAPSAWAAMFVEAMSHLSVTEAERVTIKQKSDGAQEEEEEEHDPKADADQLEAVETELERARDRVELLRADRSELAAQLQAVQRQLRRVAPPVEARDDLLEPELLDTLDYLLESGEPVAIGGPFGAGKEFVSRCAADIDGVPPEGSFVYDVAADPPDDRRVALFGHRETDDGPTDGGLVDSAQGGALIVRSAERLSDSLLLGLCNSSSEVGFRLFLNFDEPDIAARSVLADRPDNVVDRLEHREVMIPRLRRRRSILPNILTFYLHRCARRRGRRIEDFTDAAFEALCRYDYPGEVREAELIVDIGVLRADGGVVRLEDLSLDIQAAAEPQSG